MKIIAGRYKGRQIVTLRGNRYRPTTARVRKSIFDILGDINGLTVLDLFAGSGILGIEAASRGADSVTFVENDYKVIKRLQTNCSRFPEADLIIKRSDAIAYLTKCGNFDLVFADPPYGKIDLIQLIERCRKQINDAGNFILESSIHDKLPTDYQRKNKYGDTQVTFWEQIQ